MQTVPSLIGSGTAIAAAASGLVFGQPVEPSTSTTTTTTTTIIRQKQPKRQISYDRDLPIGARLTSRPSSRARSRPTSQHPSLFFEHLDQDTSSTASSVPRPPLSRYQRPSAKGLRRKLSLGRKQGSATTQADGRESNTSSNGSWVKRFSIRPSSQHEGTSRSTFGLEKPTVSHSHSSSLPILPRPQSSGRLLSRNKLVKRSPSVEKKQPSAGPSHSRSKSSYLLSLRRPPPSRHQRSATLGDLPAHVDLEANPSFFSPITSCDQQTKRGPFHDTITVAREQSQTGDKSSGWISFFHSKRFALGGGGMASRLSESVPLSRSFSGKRLSLVSNESRRKVHLVKPRMVSPPPKPAGMRSTSPEQEMESRAEAQEIINCLPSTRPLSTSLPSTTTNPNTSTTTTTNEMLGEPNDLWSTRRGAGGTLEEHEAYLYTGTRTQSTRHVSAPIGGVHIEVDQNCIISADTTFHHRLVIPAKQQSPREVAAFETASRARLSSHKRSWSSPLLISPPRTSNFHLDSPRISSFGAPPALRVDLASPETSVVASTSPVRLYQPSGSSTSSALMSQMGGASSIRQNRSSFHSVSGSDTRGFMFADEDEDEDTDFKSDTMYDSLRTAASSRLRAVETPLDSVYDESPPNTACHGKTKRLSIQDMLGSMWDDDRIVEEDENDVTAIRASDGTEITFTIHPALAVVPRLSANSSRDTALVATTDFGRLCLDDDFDEDWGDEDAHFSPLSPPSKNSSLRVRGGVHPNVRPALADFMERNHELANYDRPSDTPMSSLFDWIDPPHLEVDADGPFIRPKTASGKHEVDARGGRTSSRKGPVPAHIRSQSVPITHDGTTNAKPCNAKYGTWALGTKPVSEDWDEDFEFGCGGNDGKDDAGKDSSFQVPESIRASQPSVKAHSGQIRELSLLVNDLKRLCRHGRDMNMLDGPHWALWKEAEGVIALASPDEDDSGEVSSSEEEEDRKSLVVPEPRLTESATSGPMFGRFDAVFDNLEPAMSRIAVVRGRQSPKRRSVFSPEDDIFGGGNWPLTDDSSPPLGRSPSPRSPNIDIVGANRSVMEAVCRSMPHQTHETRYDKKVHFDTNSLKVLVRKAGELRDSLADLVRHAERITHTPSRTPRRERHADSSPAFTKVFDDPNQSPQPVSMRNGSLIDGASPRDSPSSSSMGTRLQPMTVN